MRTEFAFSARAAPRRACRRHRDREPDCACAHPVSAEGLFDFFFGGAKQQRPAAPQASFFADPFSNNPQAPPRAAVASSGPSFCVPSCDGKYFPVTARQCLAGGDVPGVLPGERDQGVLRQ